MVVEQVQLTEKMAYNIIVNTSLSNNTFPLGSRNEPRQFCLGVEPSPGHNCNYPPQNHCTWDVFFECNTGK